VILISGVRKPCLSGSLRPRERLRYVGEDAARATSLQEERVKAEVARAILELRQEAGLTQKALAELVGTTRSVISRLEDADYKSHFLSMLKRIAMALNHRVLISVAPREPENCYDALCLS
jgi:ribosome-binding protein aMBF1 (putative translation factor)